MIIETRQLLDKKVCLVTDNTVGYVDKLIFSSEKRKLIFLRIKISKTLRKYAIVPFDEIVKFESTQIYIKSDQSVLSISPTAEEEHKSTGAVIGVVAKTESGERIGRVVDLDVFSESGKINRFYIRSFFSDRIIPVDFAIAITPKIVVFKDVVNQPIFNRLASETVD